MAFKITTVNETTCSLERHSATKRNYAFPCKALHLQYIIRSACYKTNPEATVNPLLPKASLQLLFLFILSRTVSRKVSLRNVQRPLRLFPQKVIMLQIKCCVSQRSAVSPNDLRSVCCKTKPMASVKSRLICFPPVKVRCREFCLEPLRSNSSRSHSEVHKAS